MSNLLKIHLNLRDEFGKEFFNKPVRVRRWTFWVSLGEIYLNLHNYKSQYDFQIMYVFDTIFLQILQFVVYLLAKVDNSIHIYWHKLKLRSSIHENWQDTGNFPSGTKVPVPQSQHTNTRQHSCILGRRPIFCIFVKARVFNRWSAALFSLGLRWRYITFYSQPLKITTLFLLLPNAAARRRGYFMM